MKETDTQTKKKKGKVWRIIKIILLVIVAINVVSFGINQIFFSHETDSIEPYGEMVEVDGGKMHIYSMRNGEDTIVLLPGMGVALPSADFAPLMRKLSEKYTVVCVEYFGVGFSDETDTPRTNENYTQEIRAALKKAGFQPPYVLMPHSASGVYSEYYATKYPEEIAGIVMLDTTSTAQEDPEVPGYVFTMSKIQQEIGLQRLTNPLSMRFDKITGENGYTESEVHDYAAFMNHVYNDTLCNQTYAFSESVREVMGTDFPDEIPVLKLAASEVLKYLNEDYQAKHIERLGNNAELKIMNGQHFIHHDCPDEICQEVDRFIDKINKND